MGRIVALDYGSKRVGVAATDPMQMIASGIGTVHSSEVIKFLKDYVACEEVECIVVGEPRKMNNEPSESARFIDPFVVHLRRTFPGIRIERYDERFTSRMATRAMIEGGVKKKDRQNKALVDTISATIILQGYLQSIGK